MALMNDTVLPPDPEALIETEDEARAGAEEPRDPVDLTVDTSGGVGTFAVGCRHLSWSWHLTFLRQQGDKAARGWKMRRGEVRLRISGGAAAAA